MLKMNKNNQLLHTYGSIDELISFLGIIKAGHTEPQIIENIQNNLFSIANILSGENIDFDTEIIDLMKSDIKLINKTLPNINASVVPGNTEMDAAFNYAKSLTRKAEREVHALGEKQKISQDIYIFFDTLAIFLFNLSRIETYKSGKPEKVWKPTRKFTTLPEVINLDNGKTGYKKDDIDTWLKENGIDLQSFFEKETRMTIKDGQIILMRPEIDTLIANIK